MEVFLDIGFKLLIVAILSAALYFLIKIDYNQGFILRLLEKKDKSLNNSLEDSDNE
jgi:hypothetical protein